MKTPTAGYASTSPRAQTYQLYSQNDLNAVATQLNTRPRKTVGVMTPGAKFAQSVALTA
jgi:IS30 family transposase